MAQCAMAGARKRGAPQSPVSGACAGNAPKLYVVMSLFQNSVSFDRLMQFLRLKPYETALFKGCCSKT
jgi:hypothetical protein